MIKESGLEFMLNHEELAKATKEKLTKDNSLNFFADLISGSLKKYAGTYVAYRQGVCIAAMEKNSNTFYFAKRVQGHYSMPGIKIYFIPIEFNEKDFNLETARDVVSRLEFMNN